MSQAEVMLQVRDLNVRYGVVQAVKSVSFEVRKNQIVALIGANGAGKTSILRALSGLNPCTGSVHLSGRELVGLPPERCVAAGMIHCPEGRGIFGGMTVLENLQLGAYLRRDRAVIAQDMKRIFDLFPRLQDRIRQRAGTLSGGEQQMLAISRSILSRPQILLLDEPSLGLAPKVVAQIFEILIQLRQDGMTLLLVEQNAHLALSIADQAYVLETGKVVLTGTGRELLSSPEIQKHYLGA